MLTKAKQAIRAKYDSRTPTWRIAQFDSRHNGDDSHADVADSRKQAVMLSNIFLSN